MKAQRAIEILSRYQIPLKTTKDHNFLYAINLGIEALKEKQKREKRSPK